MRKATARTSLLVKAQTASRSTSSWSTLRRGEAVIYTPIAGEPRRALVEPTPLADRDPERIDPDGPKHACEASVHPELTLILAGVAPSELGSASGLLESIQQLAMSLGIAAVGTVLFDRLGSGHGPAAFVGAAGQALLVVVARVAPRTTSRMPASRM